MLKYSICAVMPPSLAN